MWENEFPIWSIIFHFSCVTVALLRLLFFFMFACTHAGDFLLIFQSRTFKLLAVLLIHAPIIRLESYIYFLTHSIRPCHCKLCEYGQMLLALSPARVRAQRGGEEAKTQQKKKIAKPTRFRSNTTSKRTHRVQQFHWIEERKFRNTQMCLFLSVTRTTYIRVRFSFGCARWGEQAPQWKEQIDKTTHFVDG